MDMLLRNVVVSIELLVLAVDVHDNHRQRQHAIPRNSGQYNVMDRVILFESSPLIHQSIAIFMILRFVASKK